MIHYKEDLTVKKVKDAEIEKNGETGITYKRTLRLKNDLTTITIKGDPKYIPRFNTGEKIQVLLINPQTQLIPEGREITLVAKTQEQLSEAKEILEQ